LALTPRPLSPEIGSARTPAHKWRQGRLGLFAGCPSWFRRPACTGSRQPHPARPVVCFPV